MRGGQVEHRSSHVTDGRSIEVLASGLCHPEGVAVLPGTGLVCGSDDGRLFAVDPGSGEVRLIAELPGSSFLGVCVDGDGGVLACDLAGRRVVRWHDGRFETLPAPADGWQHPNALCFLTDGRLIVSDSGRWSRPSGRLVTVTRTGAEPLDVAPLAFANGLCVDGDGKLWAVESAEPAVSCFSLEAERPELLDRWELPGTVPDGIAALVDGTVLVACYRPDSLLRIAAGTAEVLASDPTGLRLAGPTNLALHGPDLRSIAVACFGGYHLARVDSPEAGVPPFRPSWSRAPDLHQSS
jgi:sugar lactone lactonase YvrE